MITKNMNQIYCSHVEWPDDSVIRITTKDGENVSLQKPFLQHRWPLYQNNPEEAIQILKELSKEELKSILLYIYSDLPGKLMQREVFDNCGLKNPASLQDSTFTE